MLVTVASVVLESVLLLAPAVAVSVLDELLPQAVSMLSVDAAKNSLNEWFM
jgi:hypothetical protein